MIGIAMLPGMILISLLNLIGMEAQAATALEWFMGAVIAFMRILNWGF